MKKKLSASTSFNSPLPTNLAGECKKATNILNSFLDPGQGLDIIIPPTILENAMGLAIFTVLKAGFLFSGRAGSGLVVARLSDGSWSAPSALFTGGIGAGGQIGAELTDFVLVLNTKEAVKTFSHFGNITLGGNISIAAGPIGRNAEASGSASLKHIAAIYSYSKTRGLFAGVSLEGSVICTRSDANEKLYGERYTAKQLLNGTVPPPLEADALYRALNTKFRSFGNMGTMYQRIVEREAPKIFRNTTISAPGTLRIPPLRKNIGYHSSPSLIGPPPTTIPVHDVRHSVANHDHYNNYTYVSPSASAPSDSPTNIQYNKPFQPDSPIPQHSNNLLKPDNPVPQHVNTFLKPDSPFPEHINKPDEISPVIIHNNSGTNMSTSSLGSEKTIYNNNIPPPLFDGQRMSFTNETKQTITPPYNGQRMSFTKSSVPPPLFEGQKINFSREINNSPPVPPNPSFKHQKARAIYAYAGEQEGDLSFQPGDVILVTEKTDDSNSWWTGNFQGQSGSLPSNYVELL